MRLVKFILIAMMAMCVAISGYALEQGEFVYTPQGRFLIIGDNQNANNAFQSMDGWIAIGEGKTLEDLFSINAYGLSEGMNSVVSTAATVGEGMYYKFEPTDASGSYVVSFKMKGAALDNIRVRIPSDGKRTESNLVKVAGNEENQYTHPATEGEIIANTAEELTEDWQTFNYAIVGDGTPRTWFISFTAMATTIEVADVQIAPAIQVADLRQRDAMVEKMDAYKNCYGWDASLLEEWGYIEYLEALKAIGDESGQAELDEYLITAQEILDEFIKDNMDDYLAGNSDNYLGINTTGRNIQKVSNFGDWTATTPGRAFWTRESYPELGHYAGNMTWNYGNTDDPMGVYTQKALDPGSYVFGIESNASVREDANSSSWTINDGLNPAYGVAYIVKINEGVDPDTVVSVVKDLKSAAFTPFLITAKIQETGIYEIGLKVYCKDAYKNLRNGSVTYIANASLWGKNENQYNQRQLAYEADVREQITTGRAQLTTAAENLASADYFWGKTELQACVDTVETKIAIFEALDQDAIIATYQDDYWKSTSEEFGYLVYTIFQEAVKDIIAANKKFIAVNDTLNSIQTVIDNAEEVLNQRLYSAATGRSEFVAAINVAKAIQARMKATDYSEENADAIMAAIRTLSEAIETFKMTIPANAIETLVDINFENEAVLNEETGLYSVAGAMGSMEFSNWSADGTGNQPFEKGYWSNVEQLWSGYIRIGNGTGTVNFDPTVNGSVDNNILKVSCDMYIQGLSGKSLGFFLRDDDNSDIFGLFHNFYNWTTSNNTCDVDVNMIWAKSGGSYNNASPADVDEPTANPLQKTHFEVIMDYGTNKMYCTINSINGSTTSDEVDLNAVPTKFILQCNYNNNDRRAWFDNLKIEKYLVQKPISNEIDLGDIHFSLAEGGKINPNTGKITVTFPNVTGIEDPTATSLVLAGAFNDIEFDGLEGTFATGVTFELADFELEPATDYTLNITSVKVNDVELAAENGYKLNFKTRGAERKMAWTFTIDEESVAKIKADENAEDNETEGIGQFWSVIRADQRHYVHQKLTYGEIMLDANTPLPMTEGLLFTINADKVYVGDIVDTKYMNNMVFNANAQKITIPDCQEGDIISFNDCKYATKPSSSKFPVIVALNGAAIAIDGLLSSSGLQDSIDVPKSATNLKFEVLKSGDISFSIGHCNLTGITIEAGVEKKPCKYKVIAAYTAEDDTITTLKELVDETEEMTGTRVKVTYPYWLADADGNVYTHGKRGSEFVETFDLRGDTTFVINYSKTDIEGCVFLSEGEDLPGAALCTSANSAVRSSMAKAAYFAEDVKLCTLYPGTYKIRAVLFDANKTPNYICTLTMVGGEENEVNITASVVNFCEVESEILTITKTTDIMLKASGGDNQGVDVLMIYGEVDENTANSLYIADGQRFSTTKTNMLPISLKNEDEIVGFQFDVVLPQGMTLAKNARGKNLVTINGDRTDSHTLTASMVDDFTVRIVGTSMENEVLSGVDGVLLEMGIDVASWVPNGVYPIQLKDVKLTNSDRKTVSCSDKMFYVTVGGKLGDVNQDDAVDVTDAVLIIDHILMKNPSNFEASLADVNGDNEIDVTDVVMVIDAILGKIELSRGSEMIDRSAYTAFQMDLTIPAGYVLESVSLTDIAKDSHRLAYNMLADGRCRVVVCSMNNEALPGAWDEVISLNLRGKGDAQVNIDRAVFVTIDGERHELMLNPTSIAEISNLKSQTSNLYDLQGRKIEKSVKGILIENGKKTMRK